MSPKIAPVTEPGCGEPDYFDYCRERGEEERSPRRLSRPPRRDWKPEIIDDWPEKVPVFVEELELYELYFGDELDEILGIRMS